MTEEIKKEWIQGGAITANKVLKQDGADWYISYADDPFMGDGSETALKWEHPEEGTKWYILNGDWTKQYEEAFPDLEACKKIFLDNKEKHLCSWSVE
jgi:hypothetical protein